jgi:hypothetical protein
VISTRASDDLYQGELTGTGKSGRAWQLEPGKALANSGQGRRMWLRSALAMVGAVVVGWVGKKVRIIFL